MLAEPERTPYDLNFRLFGFPVRIHPLFWLGSLLLGGNILNAGDGNGLIYLAIWVAVVFVSILVHELGHALAFRAFGVRSHVVLWLFGGLAVPYSSAGKRWQRIAVSLAGPVAGFILCGAVYASDQVLEWSAKGGIAVALVYVWLITVNLYWGIMNLLPVFPLDGGQVSRELCEGKWRGRGLRTALQISVGVALAIVVYSGLCALELKQGGGPLTSALPWWVPRGSMYTAILFGLLAFQNHQMLQTFGRSYYYEDPDDRVPWEK